MSRRLVVSLAMLLLVAASAGAAEEPFFAPESEAAGWLWPTAFSLYTARTVVWDVPVAYSYDTPRLVVDLLGRRDADSVDDLIRSLEDPDLTVKDPLAAELRRRTGRDFGYADAAPRPARAKAINQWVQWAREHPGN